MLLFSRKSAVTETYEEELLKILKDIGQISTVYAPYLTDDESTLKKIFSQYAHSYFENDSKKDQKNIASLLTARAMSRGTSQRALQKKLHQCGFKNLYVHYNYDRPNFVNNATSNGNALGLAVLGESELGFKASRDIRYLNPQEILLNSRFTVIKNGDRSAINRDVLLDGAMLGAPDSFLGHPKNMLGAHKLRDFTPIEAEGPTFPSDAKYWPWVFYISGSPTSRTEPCRYTVTKFDYLKKLICDNKPADSWCYLVRG